MTHSQDWFCTDAGRALWALERVEVAKCLSGLAGEHALQIGPAAETQSAIAGLPYQGRWHFEPGGNHNSWCGDGIGELPLQDNTVDLVVMRHCLDLNANHWPQVVEAARVLVPGGRLLVCALNPRGWVALTGGRRRKLPLMPLGLIRRCVQQAGLTAERNLSIGLGGIGASSAKALSAPLAVIGNVHLVYCRKQRLGGAIRRMKFPLPRRVPTATLNTGVYSKTGT